VDPERPHLLVYDGETMFFDGSASSDNDEGGASIVYYEWFVNGDPRSIGPDRITFSEPIYLIGGSSQTVKLRVKDDEGSWAEKTLTLTVTSRPKRYYYLKDHLGSVRVTVNENGDVVHYDDYYPFGLQMPGRSLEEDGPKERFTGHELDDETGLFYAGARYLDPVIGRWMVVDQLAGWYPSWSPYNYALNMPSGLADKSGLCPEGVRGGEWFEDEDGSMIVCLASLDEFIVSAERQTIDHFFYESGVFFFRADTDEGREGLHEFLMSHPNQIDAVLQSDQYSTAARDVAWKSRLDSGRRESFRIMLEVGADVAGLASLLTGVGTVGGAALQLTSLRGALSVARLAQVGLYASGAEVTLRVAQIPFGGSRAEAMYAGARFSGAVGGYYLGATIASTVRPAGVFGPTFRSASTGRFVSNTYGYGIRAASIVVNGVPALF
jgi:RHS repeat-associated protein